MLCINSMPIVAPVTEINKGSGFACFAGGVSAA